MTAAHIQDDKSLVITFDTNETALRFVSHCINKMKYSVHSHDDRRVMIVGRADQIDSIAIELSNHVKVCSVHVDWYIG